MKNRAYPPSICAGIPRLGKCPRGWSTRTFGHMLRVVERPATLSDDTIYQLVNAKRNRAGIVPREQLKGKEIKTKGQYFVRAGDFLIGNRQIIHGACGIVPKELDGALVSGEYTVLHANDGLLLSWFSAFTHTTYFQQTCFHSSIGVDVEKMVFKLDWWLHHEIHVPSAGEQAIIADILSTWDDAIEQTRTLIAAAKRHKKALMQQLLTGKKRLPGVEGKWKVRRIGEFTTCVAGGTPRTSEDAYWHGSIRWMSSGELNQKRVSEVEGRITELGLRNSNATVLPLNCVLIGLAGQGKTRGTVAMNVVELCTNQSVAAILPASSFVPQYLYHNLDSRYEELRRLSTGDGGRGGLNLSIIMALRVPLPSVPEQRAIAAILTTADEEIKLLEAKCAALERQKKGLMQKLLTGEVRVNTGGVE